MTQLELGLNSYKDKLQVRVDGAHNKVLDPVRKKLVILTPEEYVRQLLLLFLIEEKGCSKTRILVEKEIKLGSLTKRFDIVVLDNKQEPFILIECKSYKNTLNQAAFEQAARYNLQLQSPYLMISNGQKNYLAFIDFETGKFSFVANFPDL